MSKDLPNTHGWIMPFGKHKGQPITRVPVGYLRWWVNEPGANHREYARAELERRGSTLPEIDISGHAVDRASLHCLDNYMATRGDGEGLYAWLLRKSLEARLHGVVDHQGRHLYEGMQFVFAEGDEYPVLKTIMQGKNYDQEARNA